MELILLLTWLCKGYNRLLIIVIVPYLHPSTNVWSSAGDVVAERRAPPPPQSSSKPAAPAAPAPTQVATAGKTPVGLAHPSDQSAAQGRW